jgi:cell division control protein 24
MGSLLLKDKFPLMVNKLEKEYFIFLFDRILLCCKEAPTKKKKGKDEELMYIIKGNIFMTAVSDVKDSSKPEEGHFELKVSWKESSSTETFNLKCRNIEQLNLWRGRIDLCIKREKNQGRPISMDEIGRENQRISDLQQNPRSLSMINQIINGGNISQMRSSTGFSYLKGSEEAISEAEENRRNLLAGHSRRSSSKASEVASAGRAQQELLANSSRKSGSPLPNKKVSINADEQRQVNPSLSSLMKEHSFSAVGLASSPLFSRKAAAANSEAEFDQPATAASYGSSLSKTRNISKSSSRVLDKEFFTPIRTILPPPPDTALPLPPTKKFAPTVPVKRVASPGPPGPAPSASLPSPPSSNVRETCITRSSQVLDIDSTITRHSTQKPYNGSANDRHITQKVEQVPLSGRITGQNVDPVASSTKSTNSNAPLLKVKTYFGTDIFILAVASDCSFGDLVEKIERKIRLSGEGAIPEGKRLKLKYKDEDGDSISISGDDDLFLAFESQRAKSAITIYVELYSS